MEFLNTLYFNVFARLPFSAFNINTFFANAKTKGVDLTNSSMSAFGILCVLAGLVFLGMAAFRKQGRTQFFTASAIAIVIGGFLTTSAYNRASNVADGLASEVNSWGGGTTP